MRSQSWRRRAAACLAWAALTRSGTALSEKTPIDWSLYEHGELGLYPQVSFHSTPATAPLLRVGPGAERCTPGYTMLTPRGRVIRGNRAFIMDEYGDLVWQHTDVGAVSNMQVVRFRGEDYLTYWVGDDEYYGHGHGYYKMLDHSYNLVYVVSGQNGLEGDYHDFSITSNNTALLTSYIKVPWDLSFQSRENGHIWDCAFQEVDVETGQVLFEWRATEHFLFTDMAVDSWQDWTGTAEDPWDWFHITGVQRDSKGNFLMTARYTNAITYIDGKTGSPLWHIGGKNSSFFDGSGQLNNFVDPQMARWVYEGSSLVVMDVDPFWVAPGARNAPTIREISIDKGGKTARISKGISHPGLFTVNADGSVQRLPNGNFFASFGSAPIFAEFNSKGSMVCNYHYAPCEVPDQESSGPAIRSYRVNKYPWVGTPTQAPDIAFTEDSLHVSWNGATQVRWWKLDGRGAFGSKALAWSRVSMHEKDSFETFFDLSDDEHTTYRLTALGVRQKYIQSWQISPEGDIRELVSEADVDGDGGLADRIIIIGCIVLLAYANRRWLVSTARRHSIHPSLS